MQRGFDRFYGTIHGAGSFFDPNTLTRDNGYIAPDADPDYRPETYYYTDAISDHAVRFIQEHDVSNPFFMYVAYTVFNPKKRGVTWFCPVLNGCASIAQGRMARS